MYFQVLNTGGIVAIVDGNFFKIQFSKSSFQNPVFKIQFSRSSFQDPVFKIQFSRDIIYRGDLNKITVKVCRLSNQISLQQGLGGLPLNSDV